MNRFISSKVLTVLAVSNKNFLKLKFVFFFFGSHFVLLALTTGLIISFAIFVFFFFIRINAKALVAT